MQKFFKDALGKDYTNHADVMENVLRKILIYGTPFKGVSLKEIIDNRFNPSWYDKISESIASFRVQKETNAKIEDAITHYLTRDMQNSAGSRQVY